MQLETTPVAAPSGVPLEVLGALRAAESELARAASPSQVAGSRAEWAEVVSTAQRVINAASAVQDEAIVAVCAIEDEMLDDGTVVEVHRAPGHVALDAPAIVSGALSVSSTHAENRVRAAVRLAADGPSGTDSATGLRALHEAMASGRLDSYRAGVLADELEQAPPDVAAAVVHSLEGSFDRETGPQLRGRCRRVLATISPDLLRQRAARAREQCGLRRWAEEPGVDKWEGTFPSEDAARAWAAIDARAQQLRADGTCPRIERARAQALIDLVTGSATVTTVLALTVPAAVAEGEGARDESEDKHGEPSPSDTALAPATGGVCTGTMADMESPSTPSDAGDRVSADALVRPVAGGASPEARRGVDDGSAHSIGKAPAVAAPSDLVEVTVSGIAQPVFVSREFLDLVGRVVESQTVTRACHPDTGALLGSGGSSAYRPPAAMVALVKQRDGRCRFPGCHVNARFCDLDHVRPWPNGPTTPSNLICLCRRHHRVKQRLGWGVRLAVDGTCTWTDPTGRVRTTWAVDSLYTVVLSAAGSPFDTNAGDQEPHSGVASMTRYDLLGTLSGQHGGLEFALEHHAAGITTAELTRAAALRTARLPATGRRTHVTIDLHQPRANRPGADGFVLAPSWPGAPGHRTSRHRRRPHHTGNGDHPPF